VGAEQRSEFVGEEAGTPHLDQTGPASLRNKGTSCSLFTPFRETLWGIVWGIKMKRVRPIDLTP